MVLPFQPVAIVISGEGVATRNTAQSELIQPPPEILDRCCWVGPYVYMQGMKCSNSHYA